MTEILLGLALWAAFAAGTAIGAFVAYEPRTQARRIDDPFSAEDVEAIVEAGLEARPDIAEKAKRLARIAAGYER